MLNFVNSSGIRHALTMFYVLHLSAFFLMTRFILNILPRKHCIGDGYNQLIQLETHEAKIFFPFLRRKNCPPQFPSQDL